MDIKVMVVGIAAFGFVLFFAWAWFLGGTLNRYFDASEAQMAKIIKHMDERHGEHREAVGTLSVIRSNAEKVDQTLTRIEDQGALLGDYLKSLGLLSDIQGLLAKMATGQEAHYLYVLSRGRMEETMLSSISTIGKTSCNVQAEIRDYLRGIATGQAAHFLHVQENEEATAKMLLSLESYCMSLVNIQTDEYTALSSIRAACGNSIDVQRDSFTALSNLGQTLTVLGNLARSNEESQKLVIGLLKTLAGVNAPEQREEMDPSQLHDLVLNEMARRGCSYQMAVEAVRRNGQ